MIDRSFLIAMLLTSLALLPAPVTPLVMADDASATKASKESHNVAPEGWTALFNGKDIDGWVVKSGYATYVAKDGMITGTTAEGSGNTFLCTPDTYKDFELKFDVLLHDNGLNSGCQVRSKVVRPGGKYGGRIGGPQVEIASGRQSGFIYGEAGLGGWWTQDVKDKRHNHFKKQQWNHFHIIAKGNTIKTYVNGNPIDTMSYPEKYKDDFQEGVIGLQVHGVKGDPKYRVSWRNIFIKTLD